MARFSEPSEPAKTLPHPELNPLQNPLLSENINRWAEVYFNNPPERRDAAVVELLEELLEEKRQRDEQYRKANPTLIPQSREVPAVQPGQENVVYCRACHSGNPATHQFCGSCGQSLHSEDLQTNEHQLRETDRKAQGIMGEASAARQTPTPDFQEELAKDDFREVGKAREEPEAAEIFAEEAEEYDSPSYSPAFANNELSIFQGLREPAGQEEEEDWEYGPQRTSSYRYYVAAVLAILIVGLGYLAWRSAQSSQASREPSPLPANPAAESAPAPVPSASSAASTKANSPQPTAPKEKTPAASQNTAASSSNDVAERHPGQKAHAMTKASDTQRIARGTNPATSHAGGSEELAMAQRYLGSADGRGRDSSEAAKWLWKAISKHNGPATLMLADLYLRGDGVSKNCDQGRVLLDSAAQRGIAGAGERLRNLQAFGCR